MGVKLNVSTEGDGNGSKLYTGVAALRVTHVNPDQVALQSLGYKAEKPQTYRGTDGKLRITFMVEGTAPGGDKIKTNIAFFLSTKKREDMWINKQGKFAKDRSKLTGELRNPYDGEIELLNFVGAWFNVKKDEDLILDSIDTIVASGDVTELRVLAEMAADKGQTVKGLLTVSEGKYQRVLTKEFVKSWSSDYSYLHKKIADNKDYIKEDIGGIDFKLYVADQFKLKPYTTTAALASTSQASSNGNGKHVDAGATAGAATAADDDESAPF